MPHPDETKSRETCFWKAGTAAASSASVTTVLRFFTAIRILLDMVPLAFLVAARETKRWLRPRWPGYPDQRLRDIRKLTSTERTTVGVTATRIGRSALRQHGRDSH